MVLCTMFHTPLHRIKTAASAMVLQSVISVLMLYSSRVDVPLILLTSWGKVGAETDYIYAISLSARARWRAYCLNQVFLHALPLLVSLWQGM